PRRPGCRRPRPGSQPGRPGPPSGAKTPRHTRPGPAARSRPTCIRGVASWIRSLISLQRVRFAVVPWLSHAGSEADADGDPGRVEAERLGHVILAVLAHQVAERERDPQCAQPGRHEGAREDAAGVPLDPGPTPFGVHPVAAERGQLERAGGQETDPQSTAHEQRLVVPAGAGQPQRQRRGAAVPDLEETATPVVRPVDVRADGTQGEHTCVNTDAAVGLEAAGRSLRAHLGRHREQRDERKETRPDASKHHGLLELELDRDGCCPRMPHRRLRQTREWKRPRAAWTTRSEPGMTRPQYGEFDGASVVAARRAGSSSCRDWIVDVLRPPQDRVCGNRYDPDEYSSAPELVP